MAAPAERVKQTAHMKTIIERGASWTLEETKLLLKLWGQDQVSRKDTPHKRTKEVYEKIASQFNEHGYERTPDQVRTRVFNMIAEYRRILKDPNPEKMKKCIFFDAMHKIYEAQHWSEVRPLLCDYDVNGRPYSPFSGEKLDMDENFISDNDTFDGQDHDNSSTEASNAGNSTSNNNNNNNNDTSESKQIQTTHTSATSDNNTSNSINEKSTTEKNPGSNDEQPNSHKRICLIPNVNNANPSPVAGTSQGDSASDAKQDTGSTTSNNVGGPSSSATSAQSASSSSAATATTQSTVSGKLQSLLASVASGSSTQATSSATPTTSAMASTTSAMTNPIIKLATPGNNSTSYINLNSTKLPIVRSQIVGHSNGNDTTNTNGTQASGTRLPTTAAITSHQLYQAPVNTFDVTSSALLIDRMFAHLSRESENMREWIALEKDRIALEKARRAQDIERESRRERVLIDTLMKFQEQWLNYLARSNPSLLEGPIPELNIPPKESE